MFFNQFCNRVANLRTLCNPVVQAVCVEAYAFLFFVGYGVVEAYAFNEATVAAVARISNDDVVERAVF